MIRLRFTDMIVAVSHRLLQVSFATLLFVTPLQADVITKLDSFLKGIDTFSAAFEQKLSNEYGEVLETSVGVVYLRRPGMFHWSYWEPYAQQIISNGMTLWVYDEDLEQVTIQDVVETFADTPAAILSGEINLAEHYVINELDESSDVQWLELTPRNIEAQYSALQLGFRENELSAMVLFDNLGQKTHISFKSIKQNPVLDRLQFEFTPPDGIDVIDSRLNN